MYPSENPVSDEPVFTIVSYLNIPSVCDYIFNSSALSSGISPCIESGLIISHSINDMNNHIHKQAVKNIRMDSNMH